MRKLIKLLLVVFLLAVSVLAQAAGVSADLTHLDIEQLMEIEVATVYGASKFEQKVTEAPASISIVTADEIKKYGDPGAGEHTQDIIEQDGRSFRAKLTYKF
jgi:iron complex outermembrane receptor protein